MRKIFINLWIKLLNFIKLRWACFVSFIFIWVIPIIMLNEKVALTNVSTGFKITFMGCIVLLVLFLASRKKIYAWINKKPHGIVRGVLLVLSKTITYGLSLGVLWAISHFSGVLYDWWLLSGISWIFGLVFLLLDEHLVSKKEGEK